MAWGIFERIYSGHYFISSYNAFGFVRDFPHLGGGKYIAHCIFVMENGVCKYIFDENEFNLSAQFAAHKLINNRLWRLSIYEKIDYYTKRYFLAGERLRKLNFFELTDDRLIKEIYRVIPYQRWHQVYSIMVNGVIIDGRNHLSNLIQNEIKKEMPESSFRKFWSILTLPTKISLRQQKEYQLAELGLKAKKWSHSRVKDSLIKIHENYCWLDYLYLGPPSTLAQFELEMNELKKNKTVLNLPSSLNQLKKKQNKIVNDLNLSRRSRFLLRLCQNVIWQKGYRKDMQYHGFYCFEPLLREIASRKKIKDWQLLFFLFPWELKDFIKKTEPGISQLKQRKYCSCFVVGKNRSEFIIGEKAKNKVKSLKLDEKLKKIRQVEGLCAYGGKIRGRVRIIQTPEDMIKMKTKDIIVSQATSPDLLPAMRKASAIVTNTGGLICHAAITARELKIPCVVGTAHATLVFKDGDLVEVDANKGMVRKI